MTISAFFMTISAFYMTISAFYVPISVFYVPKGAFYVTMSLKPPSTAAVMMPRNRATMLRMVADQSRW